MIRNPSQAHMEIVIKQGEKIDRYQSAVKSAAAKGTRPASPAA